MPDTATLLAVAKMQLYSVSPRDNPWLPISLQAGTKDGSSYCSPAQRVTLQFLQLAKCSKKGILPSSFPSSPSFVLPIGRLGWGCCCLLPSSLFLLYEACVL